MIAIIVSLGSVHAERGVESRDAKIDNVQLHFLMAGHGRR